MEIKYNSFYSHLELPESDEVSSDLDNFGCILDEKLYGGQIDIYCYSNDELALYKENPRVSDIPTVCLVTCVKTEFLPQLEFWTKENSKRNQKNFIQSHHHRSMSDRADKGSWRSFSRFCKNEIQAEKEGDVNGNGFVRINLREGEVRESLGFVDECRREKEFMIFRRQKYNKFIKMKMLHQGCQSKSKFHKKLAQNISSSYESLNVYMRILNIVHKNQMPQGMRNGSEKSVKSYFSSCSDLSIRSDNLRMINERCIQMNENRLGKQGKSDVTRKCYAKRKRDCYYFNQPNRTKYSKTDMIFGNKRARQDKIGMQLNFDNINRIKGNEGMDQGLAGECLSEFGCSIEKFR